MLGQRYRDKTSYRSSPSAAITYPSLITTVAVAAAAAAAAESLPAERRHNARRTAGDSSAQNGRAEIGRFRRIIRRFPRFYLDFVEQMITLFVPRHSLSVYLSIFLSTPMPEMRKRCERRKRLMLNRRAEQRFF
ncbi:hypothetical protein P5V15_008941 [Pogonomyrmex californicus]